jgi:probable phosphoglycerate mutase
MLFIYIRHGEPIYETDSLTELGQRQAEDVAKYLSIHGADKIYSSTANRAILTALPTAKRLNKEIAHLDFANEKYVWNELTVETPSGRDWLFHSKQMIELVHTQEFIDLGMNWLEHPEFVHGSFRAGMNRIQNESHRFFASLGYRHLGCGKYQVVSENDDRVVLFAHQGFGYAFLSLLLQIPYPLFCTQFGMGHAEITIIKFQNEGGFSYPKVLSMSNHDHLNKQPIHSGL